MTLEAQKKIINCVINNEFINIQDTQEYKETLEDINISGRSKKYGDSLDKLLEVAPEHRELINQLDSESAAYWVTMCRYYFTKGVKAGTTNLNFLKNTEIMDII